MDTAVGGGGGGGGGTLGRQSIACPRCGATTCACCEGSVDIDAPLTCPPPDGRGGAPADAAAATAAWTLGRVVWCTHHAAPVERVGGRDTAVSTSFGDGDDGAPLLTPAAATPPLDAPADAMVARVGPPTTAHHRHGPRADAADDVWHLSWMFLWVVSFFSGVLILTKSAIVAAVAACLFLLLSVHTLFSLGRFQWVASVVARSLALRV